MPEVPLIGSVVEHPTTRPKPTTSQASSSRGFPIVEHRSKAKSAFARSRETRIARLKDGNSVESGRLREAPIVISSSSLKTPSVLAPASTSPHPSMASMNPTSSKGSGRNDGWRESMHRQNEQLIAQMSDEERKIHAEEIMDQLGPNVQDLVRKLKARRTLERGFHEVEGMGSQEGEFTASQISERAEPVLGGGKSETKEEASAPEQPLVLHEVTSDSSPPRLRSITRPTSPLRGILVSPTASSPSTRPGTPTKMSRRGKLRFKEVGKEDVRVFQSEPSSPRKVLGLLPAPEPSDAAGSFSHGSLSTVVGDRTTKDDGYTIEEKLEEGTPEDIRRRFFPNLPAHDPALEWIEGPSSVAHPPSSPTSSAQPTSTLSDSSVFARDGSDLRFDLTGEPVPPSLQSSLPTHLGLHHHEEGDKAGYTLSELYMLARSNVTAQRSLGLGVLSRVVGRFAEVTARYSSFPSSSILADKKGETQYDLLMMMRDSERKTMRQRALVLGLLALDEKGAGGSGRNIGVLIQAIDLVFTCVVLWDQTCVEGLHGIELKETSSHQPSVAKSTEPLRAKQGLGEDTIDHSSSTRTDADVELDADPLASLPHHALLSQLASFFPYANASAYSSSAIGRNESTLPQPSLNQLLAILDRLARHSVSIAEAIVKGEGLVEGVLRWGLAEPASAFYLLLDEQSDTKHTIGETDDVEIRIIPEVVQLLKVLAESSRTNALALQTRGVPDALLRFVTSGLPPSIFPSENTTSKRRELPLETMRLRKVALDVVAETLEFYASLARFGLYSSVATIASDHFSSLFASCSSLLPPERGSREDNECRTITQLRKACLRLLEGWIVCATDPHKTTPPHELLWTQVDGWVWGDELLTFRASIIETFSAPNDGADAIAESTYDMEMSALASVWDAMAVWLEGCRINRPKAGAEEKDVVGVLIQNSWSSGSDELEKMVLRAAIRRMKCMLSPNAKDENILRRLVEASDVLSAFSRMAIACISRPPETASQPTELKPWIVQGHALLLPIAFSLLACDDLGRDVASNTLDPLYKHRMVFARHASAFLAHFSSLHRAIVALSLPESNRSRRTDSNLFGLASLTKFAPGYEGHALNIITSFIYTLDGASQRKASLLLPFFMHTFYPIPVDDTLEPSDTHALKSPAKAFAIGPVNPLPQSLSSTTTQLLPADCTPFASSSPLSSLAGLPLRDDWVTIALDHLLRSGTSAVLTNPNAVPEGWAPSEVDLAQASLGMMLALHRRFESLPILDIAVGEEDFDENSVSEAKALSIFAPTMEECAFACMKVFMLEHSSPTARKVGCEADSSDDVDLNQEVFRDPGVGQLMEDLLRPFTITSMPSLPSIRTERHVQKKGRNDLSSVSLSFLGPGTPFFQFYTDFLTLYDAISFAHPTFARLLLVPLSNHYENDYRKLLWGDFGHVLRTVRTAVGDVLISQAGEAAFESFFYPPEDDVEMIGFYLRALVSGPLEGFVRLLAIHHVAHMIWPDLRHSNSVTSQRTEGESSAESMNARAKSLLLAVFMQANSSVVSEVVRYSQPLWPFDDRRKMRPPPACFEGLDARAREERIAFLKGETRLEEAVTNILRS